MNLNLVSLTKIHKEHGGEVRHLPNKFSALMGDLVGSEIFAKRGRYGGGTFATKRVSDLYVKWIKKDFDMFLVRSYCQRESAALSTIEQLLNVELERQYKVGIYRIDGYDSENNVAYEIDEKQHLSNINKLRDSARESYIVSRISCKFVRIKV